MSPRMREAQSHEGRAERGVSVRRALPLEVWQKGHALGAGRDLRRFFDETRVALIGVGELARELIAVPRERATCREDDADDVPHAGHEVAEGVRAQAWVHTRRR